MTQAASFIDSLTLLDHNIESYCSVGKAGYVYQLAILAASYHHIHNVLLAAHVSTW